MMTMVKVMMMMIMIMIIEIALEALVSMRTMVVVIMVTQSCGGDENEDEANIKSLSLHLQSSMVYKNTKEHRVPTTWLYKRVERAGDFANFTERVSAQDNNHEPYFI